MAVVLYINKGVNRSMEFKGLKGQYIWYLAGGLMGTLLLFAIMYVCHVNNYICTCIAFVTGGGSIWVAYRLSDKYGEFGLMKRSARRSVPKVLKSYSRSFFCVEKKLE